MLDTLTIITMTILDDLRQSKAEVLRHFDLADADLERTYGPGKWSIRYLLHHLADSESVFNYRIRRVISEERQLIFAYDQDAWARALDYGSLPLDLSRRLFEANRDSILYLAERHYAGSESRSFVHTETGLRTLKDEFDKVVWHTRKHLDQIAQALG